MYVYTMILFWQKQRMVHIFTDHNLIKWAYSSVIKPTGDKLTQNIHLCVALL